MALFSFRSLVVAAVVSSGGLAAIAACSDNSSLNAGSGDDASTSGGANESGSASASGSSSGAATSSGGSGNSGAVDSGLGGISADALVTYDGPPGNVDGGHLLCPTPDGLPIKFNPIYSGYDSVHMYQVPVYVVGADPSTITWGASDPSMVDLQPYVRGVMITTRKAGDTTIVAKQGTKCGAAPLHIAAYTADQWAVGSDRYHNDHPLMVNIDAAIPDGGFDGSFDGSFPEGGYDAAAVCAALQSMGITDPFTTSAPACTNCHGSGSNGMLFGVTLFSDIAHTPEQTGGFSEDELTNAFFRGAIPEGGVYDPTITPYCVWHLLHQWTDIDTPDKQAGMRAYLRSLTPQEQTGCFELFNANLCADGGQ